MSSHCEGGGTPCEACLDWRIDEGRSVAAHVVKMVSAVLTDFGIDVTDQAVRTRVAARMREYGTGIDT